MNHHNIESQLHNLSELIAMKDPNKLTTVESALKQFIAQYFSDNA